MLQSGLKAGVVHILKKKVQNFDKKYLATSPKIVYYLPNCEFKPYVERD